MLEGSVAASFLADLVLPLSGIAASTWAWVKRCIYHVKAWRGCSRVQLVIDGVMFLHLFCSPASRQGETFLPPCVYFFSIDGMDGPCCCA